MPVVTFSEHFVRTGLVCPSHKKRTEFCDQDLPGLFIEVRSATPGQGTWYLRYKSSSGKTAYESLGTTQDTSLTQARSKAASLKARIREGVVPVARAPKPQKVVTFDAFMEGAKKAGFDMPVQDLDELAQFLLQGIRNEDFVIMIGRETMEATLVERAKKLAAGECPIELEHMGLS